MLYMNPSKRSSFDKNCHSNFGSYRKKRSSHQCRCKTKTKNTEKKNYRKTPRTNLAEQSPINFQGQKKLYAYTPNQRTKTNQVHKKNGGIWKFVGAFFRYFEAKMASFSSGIMLSRSGVVWKLKLKGWCSFASTKTRWFRSLNLWKVGLTIPKRSQRIATRWSGDERWANKGLSLCIPVPSMWLVNQSFTSVHIPFPWIRHGIHRRDVFFFLSVNFVGLVVGNGENMIIEFDLQ